MVKEDIEAAPIEKLTEYYFLNHFLLQKERKRSVVEVAGALCGLHAQLALTPYFSLWNRVNDFRPEMLDEALYKEKSLVKTWCTRGTLHIIPSEDLPIYHNALKRMWFEHHGRFMQKPDWPSFEERKRLLHQKIVEALAEKPLRRKELSNKAWSLLDARSKPYERLFSAWGGILKETSYLGLTVYAEPCGKEACFSRLDQWLPQIKLDEIDEKEAREKLLLKYLHCYGPASAQDVAYWSGIPTSEVRKIIENTMGRLREIQVENCREKLWIPKEDFKRFTKTDLEKRVQLYLLPKFDPYLLGHKDKTRIIENSFLKRIYRPAGDIVASVLVNGRIAGT